MDQLSSSPLFSTSSSPPPLLHPLFSSTSSSPPPLLHTLFSTPSSPPPVYHRCSTERRHDVLVIKDGGGAVIAVRSGRDAADWAQDIRVVGDELSWTFKSDGSVNGWGFRFTVQPLMPKKIHGGMLLSDRVLQSRPSIDLVTCLLDFQLGRSPRQECISRLGASLASCAQLNALDASQRMWAIQHLRKLINSCMSAHLVSGAMGTCCPLKQVCTHLLLTPLTELLFDLLFFPMQFPPVLFSSFPLSFLSFPPLHFHSLSLSSSFPSGWWWLSEFLLLTGAGPPRSSSQAVQL